MFGKILVPLDGSKTAEKALQYARHLARQNDSLIYLVYICADIWMEGNLGAMGVGPYPLAQDMADSEKRSRESYLEVIRGELEKEGLRAVSHCFRGDPAGEILQLSQQEGFNLIVLTSHGRSGASHFFFGSVAEWLARQCPCPVMIIGHNSIEAHENEIKKELDSLGIAS